MRSPTFDRYSRGLIADNPRLMVPWYLMASYLYYEHNTSILSDPWFDHLCARLLEWRPLLAHQHLHLVEPEALEVGTGFQLDFDNFPRLITDAARHLAKNLEGKEDENE